MENLNYPWKEKWTSRNKLVAKYVRGKSILDIGGGLGGLKRFLKRGTDYISIDLKQWTPETIIYDLNTGFPLLYRQINTTVCQGIIEYIKHPFEFLKGIQMYSRRLVLTYRTGKENIMERNNFSQESIERLIKASGWKIIKNLPSVSKFERIYICTKK